MIYLPAPPAWAVGLLVVMAAYQFIGHIRKIAGGSEATLKDLKEIQEKVIEIRDHPLGDGELTIAFAWFIVSCSGAITLYVCWWALQEVLSR